MVHCIVVGCASKSGKSRVSFHTIPKIVSNQGEEHEELTRERRRRWISAISRGDTETKRILDSERVCGLHFVTGKAAASWDRYHIDWVPTLNLGKPQAKQPTVDKQKEEASLKAERAKERRKRSIERQQIEAAKKRKELEQTGLTVQNIDFAIASTSTEDVSGLDAHSNEACGSTSYEYFDGDETEKGIQTVVHEMIDRSTSTEDFEVVSEGRRNRGMQTQEFNYLFKNSVYQAPDKDFFQSPDKVRFYTGLPSFDILMVVFEHVSPYVSRRSDLTSLNSFQEFIIVLMKLRLNVPFQDFAYRFEVSLTSVSRVFTSWIHAMDSRLSCFIHWPAREQLWKTMPMCFQYTFGRKVTVIIDCFEVFIEKPTNLMARAQTFSSYKNHNTVKILIGITPQGTISFVSEAWGGRTSDKFLTENCGILEKLIPGDTIMADRGFTISESVGLKQGKLVILAFTKGKAQLHPVDVERSRGIANVRIHVERVIGLLRRKYTILEGTLPTKFLSCDQNGPTENQVPIIDRILRVCSALVNFCPSIVPLD
ncbi:uncharacterized protein LOC125570212 [Nematostella vectensis]|uniref:uncharacterized protein LOC125570212 n=1 Tax=Nematostella vectensis TaxID=45351 RepID=UPI002077041F|nr:uncharacterized protein LOC125570212 [Nematostella vectensis]